MAPAQSGQGSAKTKQSEKPRACDICRKRKTKCKIDSEAPFTSSTPFSDRRCKRCRALGLECTYEDNSKRLGFTWSHSRYLEAQIRSIERKVLTIHPSLDQDKAFGPPIKRHEDAPESEADSSDETPGRIERLRLAPPLASGFTGVTPANSPTPGIFNGWREQPSLASDNDSIPSSDNEYCNNRPPQLGTYTEDLCVATARYHGPSSQFSMVRETRRLTRHYKVAMECEVDEVDRIAQQMEHALKLESKLGHKSKIQAVPPSTVPPLVFPPSDLLAKLVDLYFYHTNSVRPLLHRPLFQNDLNDERHKTDHTFGCVVLAVCALGSRYSDDPRVLPKVLKREHRRDSSSSPSPSQDTTDDLWVDDLEETPPPCEWYEDAPWQSAGWKYYDRLDLFMRSDAYQRTFLEAINLSQAQLSYLLWQFLQGSPDPGQGWVMVGIAIRRVQDVGAHLKKRYSSVSRSVEGELWKRAVGCLMLADRDAGLCGRPGFAYAEYFDKMFPLQVDDEYWAMGETGPVFLQQPPGKPATISAFTAQLKLSVICEAATSKLHPLAENRIQPWFQPFHLIGHLEAAMSKWMESLPSHLKYKVGRSDPLWNIQSTILHIRYHLLRMHIYRTFLPIASSGASSPSTFSDVSRSSGFQTHRMCTNVPSHADAFSVCALSSRVIASLLSLVTAEGRAAIPLCDVPAFIAGAYFAGEFLGKMRGVKRRSPSHLDSSTPPIADGSIADNRSAFNVCIDALEALQDRWESAQTHLVTPRLRRRKARSALRSRTPSEPDAVAPLLGSPRQEPDHEPLVPTYTERYVQSQWNLGPEVLQPVPVSGYVQSDLWDIFSGVYADDATATAQHSLGVNAEFQQQPALPLSNAPPEFKDYGHNQSWEHLSQNAYFEAAAASRSPSGRSAEQVPYPSQELRAPRISARHLPASQTTAPPVAQQFYGAGRHVSHEVLLPVPTHDYNSFDDGYTEIASSTNYDGSTYRLPPEEYQQPSGSRQSQSHIQNYHRGNPFPQCVPYARQHQPRR